jgi:tripartite-type tricarboxylate transporter receptor subunit TctC
LAVVNGATNRPYVLPPGTPKDRVKILRKAFMDTVKDPEFLADTSKAKLDIDALDGAEIERQINALFKLDRSLIQKLKDILK